MPSRSRRRPPASRCGCYSARASDMAQCSPLPCPQNTCSNCVHLQLVLLTNYNNVSVSWNFLLHSTMINTVPDRRVPIHTIWLQLFFHAYWKLSMADWQVHRTSMSNTIQHRTSLMFHWWSDHLLKQTDSVPSMYWYEEQSARLDLLNLDCSWYRRMARIAHDLNHLHPSYLAYYWFNWKESCSSYMMVTRCIHTMLMN